jgi:hypothetical protein
MMRKSIVLLLVGLLAVALSSSVTVAQGQVLIPANGIGGHYDVDLSEGEVPVVFWGWVACSRGHFKAFVKAFDQHEYSLNGVPLLTTEQANENWGPVEEAPAGWDYCIAQGLSPKISWWMYELDLEPGEYELHSTAYLAHPVTDGLDIDGDGRPDVYSGEMFDTVNTIHVVE